MSTVYDEKLLDKVGLAMVPSGYTNNAADEGNAGGALGKVYSVLPIQTTSDNLVTNGDFSDGFNGWSTLGIGNATVSNGALEFPDTTASYAVQQNIVALEVKTHILKYTIKTSNEGNLGLGGGSSAFETVTLPNTVGTHSVTLTSNAIDRNLQFRNNNSFVGTIDDISLVKVINGDFDFSRGSDATRVNSQGYIESVQVIGDNLVQNGRFEEIGDERLNYTTFSLESENLVSNPTFQSTLGSELINNGSFDTNASGWNVGQWVWSNGALEYNESVTVNNAANHYFTPVLPTNKVYKVQFDIITQGTARLLVRFLQQDGNTYDLNGNYTDYSSGTYTYYATAIDEIARLQMWGQSTSDTFSIDNVSVKEVDFTSYQSVGSGISPNPSGGISVNNTSGADSILDSGNFDIEAYENYQIEIDVANITAGSLFVSLDETGGADITSITSSSPDGVYTVIKEPNFTGQRSVFITFSNGFVGDVKSISVRKTNLDGVNANYNVDVSQDIYIENNRLVYKYRPGLSQYLFFGLGNGDITGPQYEVNKVYKVEIQGEGNVAFRPAASGPNSSNVALTLPATYYFRWDAADSNHRYQIGRSGTDSIAIDSISLKEVGQNWTFGTGWSVAEVNGSQVAQFNGGADAAIQQSGVISNSVKYRLSLDVLNKTTGSLQIRFGNTGIVDETITTNGTFTYDIISDGTTLYFRSIGGFDGAIDNVSVVEVTDDTDIPRLDYTNAACPSLLLEPQRTNYITDTPSSFVNADWGDDVLSPEGKVNGKSFVPNTTPNTTHYVSISSDSSINIASNSVTFSFYAKEGSSSIIRGRFDESSFTERLYFAVDISDGTFLFSGSASSTAIGNIEESINGWKRVSMTVTYTSAPTGSQIICYIGSGDNFATDIDSYTGDGSAFIYFYGFQMENGSYPTSYIPTSGLLVTRRLDLCNNAGDSTIFNDSEGVLYAEIKPLSLDYIPIGGNDGAFSIGDSQNHYIKFWFQPWYGDRTLWWGYKNDSTTFNISLNLGPLNLDAEQEYFKIAYKYKPNDFSLWVNGKKVDSQNTYGTFDDGDLKSLAMSNGLTGKCYGNVRQVLYFNEALSDAELEYITSDDIDLTIHNYKGSLNKISATYEDVGVKDRLTKLF